jgi:two-component system, response regulator YesN
MPLNAVVFFNFYTPLIAGLFFLIYFVYFILAKSSRAVSYRYFVLFLAVFALFIMGRALQTAAGPDPLPLVIVNVRMFILCGVIVPLVMLMSSSYRRKKAGAREIVIGAFGIALGLTYDIFNTLGTRGSQIIFSSGAFALYDALTPSMLPPFYGREVTLGVQVITGLILLAFSADKLVRLKLENKMRELVSDKNFLINSGIFIFAVSFIVGSLLKQWWVFYLASMASALFVGASVLIDVKEVHSYYEKLLPFAKEDIVAAFAFKDFSKARLSETFRMLGKRASMDTFTVMKLYGVGSDDALDTLDAALGAADRSLGAAFDEGDYVLLPISNDRIGIVLSLLKGKPGAKLGLLEALEQAHAEIETIFKGTVKTGIGRSYADIEDLRSSYFEACNAAEHAEQFDGSCVMQADDIGAPNRRTKAYPVREKERLLAAVRVGGVAESEDALRAFMDKFGSFIEENPGALGVRLYELTGSLIDSAILGGGDEKKLNDLVTRFFADVGLIKDLKRAREWLSGVVEQIAGNVGCVFDSRSKTLIENAKRIIEKNFASQFGYKDVAREIFISPSYFMTLFKKETGLTFTDYLTEVRIKAAKDLLRTSEKTITEIAFDVGFNNSNYFSNTFKKAAGLSAKEYRNRK